MSRYITKYINLEMSKRPTFWNGGSINFLELRAKAPAFIHQKTISVLKHIGGDTTIQIITD